jgi:hypothetical protein
MAGPNETYTDETGAPIAPENLAKALSEGNAFGAPDADYTLKDAGGQIVKVKGANIPVALGSGYTIVPPDVAALEARRHELESAPVATMLERGASMATFGGFDVAARALDPQFADDMAARAQMNEGAASIGAGAGLLLPTGVASGASRLVGKALQGAETATAAGRMAMRAAQGTAAGGLEGALYGAGAQAGDAALKGDELTAEKLLSGAGQGALFGALLGGGGGAIAGRIENAFAGRAAAKAGEMDSLLAKKTADLTAKLQREGASAERIAAEVAEQSAKLGQKESKIQAFANAQAMRTLEPSAKLLKERAARAGGSVDDLIQQAGKDYLGYEIKTGPMAGKRIFHGARNPVDVIDDVGHALKETRQSVGHYEVMAQRAAETMPQGLPPAAPVQANLNSILASGGKRKPGAFQREVAVDLAPVLMAEERLALTDLRAASDAIGARIERTTGKAQIRQLSEVKRTLDDAAAIGTKDTLRAAGLDVAGYTEAQQVHRSLSLVHDAISEMKLETKSGKHEGGLTGYAMAATLLGNFPQSILAGASVLAHKLISERAGGIAAEVAHRVASSDVRLGWGAKAIAGDAWNATRRVANAEVNAAPLIQRVQELSGNPGALNAFAADSVADVAKQYPDLGTVALMKTIGDIQHLAARAPAPLGRNGASMTPAATKSGPTPKAAQEWLERAKALSDPGFVVDEVLRGRVPTAAIETLKERRPALWEELRQSVAREVAVRSDELPFKRRITIGLAFEFSADKSLEPGMIRSIQTSAFPPQGESAPNGLPQAGPGRPGKVEATGADSLQSMTEQIASGA